MTVRMSGNELELAPLRKHSRVLLALFIVVLPGIAIVAVLATADQSPPGAGAFAAAAVTAALIAMLLLVTARRGLALENDGLVLRATLYTRRLALDEIDLDGARIVDLREHPECRPLLKTNGLAVPGFAAGNFRDRRRNKLFCLVTAPRVVILPLKDGRRVLVSPAHPARFLDRLRADPASHA